MNSYRMAPALSLSGTTWMKCAPLRLAMLILMTKGIVVDFLKLFQALALELLHTQTCPGADLFTIRMHLRIKYCSNLPERVSHGTIVGLKARGSIHNSSNIWCLLCFVSRWRRYT
jgi:hypothetical protein